MLLYMQYLHTLTPSHPHTSTPPHTPSHPHTSTPPHPHRLWMDFSWCWIVKGPFCMLVTPSPTLWASHRYTPSHLHTLTVYGNVSVDCLITYSSHPLSTPYTLSQLTHPHTQHDVIGQNLADITDEDDLLTITKNLQPSTTPPSTHLDGRTELQQRQFFVRIKSSLTPGRMQISRFKFKSHIVSSVNS